MSKRMLNMGDHQAMLEVRSVDQNQVDKMVADKSYHPVAARILAARCGQDATRLHAPGLRSLTNPSLLPDVETACERLEKLIANGEIIGLVTDHDVDGVTSHAVLLHALQRLGVAKEHIRSYIGHRLKDGYGLSDHVADRILADKKRPAVVITADCGSSDEPRIARLKAAGVEVIVTDHHEMGFAPDDEGNMVETPPPSALAVINPTRKDSDYDDLLICGCMVSWLTMCVLRDHLGKTPENNLMDLLDYVALGTMADCVSIGKSYNNRAVLQIGMQMIEKAKRPCWRAARAFMQDPGRIASQDLAFGIGPRINARGRLDEAMAGVHFLMSATDEEAESWAKTLDEVNTERKAIEGELKDVAIMEAEIAVDRGDKGLAIWLEAGHPGVHGIVASRVLERFGHPVICLSPHATEDTLATGSARSPEGVHIRDVMETIDRAHPGLLMGFGGHAAAGGLTLHKKDVPAFQKAFAEATSDLNDDLLVPRTYTDGSLSTSMIDRDLIDALYNLEPYGQQFREPLFETEFYVLDMRFVGQDKNHLQLKLMAQHRMIKAIWFFALSDDGEAPCQRGDTCTFVYTPDLHTWNHRTSVQLRVKGIVV